MTISEKQKSNDAIVGCEYVFADEISAETSVGGGSVAITLSASKEWKPIYFTPGSASLASQVSNPFQGKIVESKFEMKVPGITAAMTEEFSRIVGRSICIKLIYDSGNAMICGGKNRKLRLYSSMASGTQNGYTVGFEYKSKSEFLWLNESN